MEFIEVLRKLRETDKNKVGPITEDSYVLSAREAHDLIMQYINWGQPDIVWTRTRLTGLKPIEELPEEELKRLSSDVASALKPEEFQKFSKIWGNEHRKKTEEEVSMVFVDKKDKGLIKEKKEESK